MLRFCVLRMRQMFIRISLVLISRILNKPEPIVDEYNNLSNDHLSFKCTTKFRFKTCQLFSWFKKFSRSLRFKKITNDYLGKYPSFTDGQVDYNQNKRFTVGRSGRKPKQKYLYLKKLILRSYLCYCIIY